MLRFAISRRTHRMYSYAGEIKQGTILLGRVDGSTFADDASAYWVDPTPTTWASVPDSEFDKWGVSRDTYLPPEADWYLVFNRGGISLEVGPFVGRWRGDDNAALDVLDGLVIDALRSGIVDSDDTIHKLIVPLKKERPRLEDFSGGYMTRCRALANGEEPDTDDDDDDRRNPQ